MDVSRQTSPASVSVPDAVGINNKTPFHWPANTRHLSMLAACRQALSVSCTTRGQRQTYTNPFFTVTRAKHDQLSHVARVQSHQIISIESSRYP